MMVWHDDGYLGREEWWSGFRLTYLYSHGVFDEETGMVVDKDTSSY